MEGSSPAAPAAYPSTGLRSARPAPPSLPGQTLRRFCQDQCSPQSQPGGDSYCDFAGVDEKLQIQHPASRKTNMKTFFTTWIVALMFAASLAATLAGDVTKNAMRQKLTFAQGILEGLALEKYDLIITNAVQLRDLSQTN